MFNGHPFAGESLFDTMFGFGGGHGAVRRRRHNRGEDTVHPLKVSLEDLFNGKTAKLQLGKNIICQACNGIGGREGATQMCSGCKGRGMKLTIRQLGPGMVQQMHSVCPDCRGEGQMIAERDRCKTCEGKKVVKETKLLEVKVTPGMRENQRITFRGEGDQEPGIETGDVIIVLQQKEHDLFVREGDNLFMKHSVNLTEALCGFQFVVKHLDGRNILVRCPAGDIIEPGSVRGIPGEGMPRYKYPSVKGNLYIKFDIDFPTPHFASESALKKLEAYLTQRPKQEPIPKEHEEVNLLPFEEHHIKHEGPSDRNARGRREAYDEESDDDSGGFPGMGGGAQRVQCAQQ